MNKNDTILIAGGYSGMVGTAIVRSLKRDGYSKLLTPSRGNLDLLNYTQVENYFKLQVLANRR